MKKRILIILCMVFAILCLVACGKNGDSDYGNNSSVDSGSPIIVTTNRLIVYTADLSLTVDDIAESEEIINAKVKELNGFTASSYKNDNGRASYTFRIPTESLETFIESIEANGDVDYKDLKSEDITEKYTAAQTTLEGLKLRLQKYEEMNTEGWDVKDLAILDDKITEVTTQIDAVEKRINTYKNDVDYSTVNLTLYKRQPEPTFWSQLGETFTGSIGSMGDIFKAFLIILTALSPYVLLVLIGFGIYCIIKLIVCVCKHEKFTLFKNARLKSTLKKKIKKSKQEELENRVNKYLQEEKELNGKE